MHGELTQVCWVNNELEWAKLIWFKRINGSFWKLKFDKYKISKKYYKLGEKKLDITKLTNLKQG